MVGKLFRALWRAANALSTLQWLSGLLPAGALAVIGGVIAHAEHMPPVFIGLAALAAAVLGYILWVGLLLHRQYEGRAALTSPSSTPFRQPVDDVLDNMDRLSRSKLAGARAREADAIDRRIAAEKTTAADRVIETYGGPKREVHLSEALGWAIHGKWGESYLVGGIAATMTHAIVGGTDPKKLLARCTELAREGKLTMWGKRENPGYFEKIPKSHWENNGLTIADVFGTVVSGNGDNPYHNLMLNRAEVEEAWPHEG